MKLKELFYAIGLKPGTKEYTFEIDRFTLPREGEISFARWQHPSEAHKDISQSLVDSYRKFLREGDVVIDIGSHSGDTTVPIALAVGSSGAVFALEPNRYVFKVLLANAALNRPKTNIFPLNFAATPEDGDFEFEYSDSGFCNGGRHEGISQWKHAHFFKLQVKGKNLVRYLEKHFPAELKRVRFIKIDTEGFDRQVAKSLRPLLEANRPLIKSEIYKHLSAEERVGYYEDLRGLGYRIFKCNSDEDLMGPELQKEEMSKWNHFDIFAKPDESK